MMAEKKTWSILQRVPAVLAVTGCQKAAAPQSVSSVPTTQATPTATPASMIQHGNPEAKTYNGTGVVKEVNLVNSTLVVDHEEIKGLMPKTEMGFAVREKSDLEKLKVGDKVNFVLEVNSGKYTVVSVGKK